MRRWRDSHPNQRGDSPHGPGTLHPGSRRRAGPQAINVRRGEARGAADADDEPRFRSRRGAVRESTRPIVPVEPRVLAIVGAVAVVLVILAVVLTRAISTPSAEPAAGPAATVVSPTPSGPTPVPTQGPVQATIVPLEPSYTVQPGDTLAILARRFNTTVDALVSINNLTDRNSLRVGQRLIIPNQ